MRKKIRAIIIKPTLNHIKFKSVIYIIIYLLVISYYILHQVHHCVVRGFL